MTGLVLDNEALQVLAHPHHRKHPELLAFIAAQRTRTARARVVPALLTSAPARVEAGLDRQAATSAAYNRFHVLDVAVTAERADRAVGLNARSTASAVDACLAELATSLGAGTAVLTSDVSDVRRLLSGTDVVIHRL